MFSIANIVILIVISTTSASSIHKRNVDTEEAGARGCRFCAPGYGVVALCNGTQDTTCAPCPVGTYNDKYTMDKPCTLCGSCDPDFYERTPCISDQDVNCASCVINGGGFGNEDFLRKCETTTTRTTTPITTTLLPSTSTTSPFVNTYKHVEQKSNVSQMNETTIEELSSGEGEIDIFGSGDEAPVAVTIANDNLSPDELIPVKTTAAGKEDGGLVIIVEDPSEGMIKHILIPAKPLHNHDIVSIHFNHLYCIGMCYKLSRDLAMLTYI